MLLALICISWLQCNLLFRSSFAPRTKYGRRGLGWRVTIQMKAIEQFFHVTLFIMLYKVVLSFESFLLAISGHAILFILMYNEL